MIFRALLSLLTLSPGRFVVGNAVVLDIGDGVYAVLAHLRRGSVRVRKGDRVRAGDVLGEVGNSGNSSEPHLHFHLMDRPRPGTAAGVPFAFRYESDGEVRTGVPAGRRPFVPVVDETVVDETVVDETVVDETVVDETVADETVTGETAACPAGPGRGGSAGRSAPPGVAPGGGHGPVEGRRVR